jgi:membrane protein implicated in regulation of membrane protease activity
MNHFHTNPTLEAAIILVVNFLIVVFSFTLVTILQCAVLSVTLGYTFWKWYHDWKDKKTKKSNQNEKS